ncbi:GDSL-type esterase/lipase family protein [Myxococcota bacterium]|nr:GDSL-type esterase/lipase family protein [Myxococcota bacterium]
MARCSPLLAAPLALALTGLPAAAASPGVPTPVEGADHLDPWFQALRAAAAGQGVARALHYGDSTLAADGLARTVRDRLQARFGDAGPGFVPASFLPQWSVRSDVRARRGGDWAWRTILYGGGGGRYGLGGIVGILRPGASVRVEAVRADAADAVQVRPQRRLEVWYQAGVGYGDLVVQLDGVEARREPARAAATEDRRLSLDPPAAFSEVRIASSGGTVPVYGLVLESGAAGATWETLAVSGVGSRSFSTFAAEALAPQVAQRDPDLVVVMLGGNEAGYPVLSVGDGAGYAPIFQAGLDTILAGAPDAACLVITPLDQGERELLEGEEPGMGTGEARSKRGMPNLVARQREVALARGCAFWSAWAAMGGQGASVAWTRHRGLTTGDLVHLTGRGLEVIGGLLSDALLQSYDAWAAKTPAG